MSSVENPLELIEKDLAELIEVACLDARLRIVKTQNFSTNLGKRPERALASALLARGGQA